MSETYDNYENWEEEGQDSPLALVGILVMALTGAAIIVNALFMQPKSAEIDLITRAGKQAIGQQTTGTISARKSDQSGAALKGDRTAMTLAVQRQLTMAGYYVGPLDGLEGAQTREAILAYQDAMGMPGTGRVSLELHDILTGKRNFAPIQPKQIVKTPISAPDESIANDAPLIAKLPKAKPANLVASKSVPKSTPKRLSVAPPAPRSNTQIATGPVPPENIPTSSADPTLAKVQLALRKVGYGNLTVDGVMGNQTREAIADFQRNRGLPVTGQVDDRLLQDMMILGYLDLG